jgi:hypothetical protein
MRALSCTTMAFALTCVLCCPLAASAATVSEKAKESGCVNKPIVISGTMYRCLTQSAGLFLLQRPRSGRADPRTTQRVAQDHDDADAGRISENRFGYTERARRCTPQSAGDELATEEKLLAEARAAYAEGAPSALPDERANVEKYRERIAKLRQAVSVHEKNVEALKKELASGR